MQTNGEQVIKLRLEDIRVQCFETRAAGAGNTEGTVYAHDSEGGCSISCFNSDCCTSDSVADPSCFGGCNAYTSVENCATTILLCRP
jgi:hypothetical protein